MTLYDCDWMLEDELLAMARPNGTPMDAAELKEMGIGAVVTLTPWEWGATARAGGLEYLHLPMPDFAPPAPQQVDEFVSFCDDCLARGRAVAVHCIAGRGRTGTMVACYMVHRGALPGDAILYVRQRRYGAIETPGQEQAIHEYAGRIGRTSD